MSKQFRLCKPFQLKLYKTIFTRMDTFGNTGIINLYSYIQVAHSDSIKPHVMAHVVLRRMLYDNELCNSTSEKLTKHRNTMF